MSDFTIGDVRVSRVEEMTGRFLRASESFLDYDEAAFRRQLHWLVPHHYDPGSDYLISSIHSWVLRINGRTILIDTCVGNDRERPGADVFHMLDTPYLSRLAAAGVRPEEVDVVLCTHLHVDHVGWNTRLENGRWVPTFPNAKYVMSAVELDHWTRAAGRADASQEDRNIYNDSVLPIVESGLSSTIDGEYELDKGLIIRPAPGHTPGQVRLDLLSGGRRAVFSGDVMHHPLQIPMWRWANRICHDPAQARETRHDVLAHCAEHHALLVPAHFAAPHVAYITAAGDEFAAEFP